MNKEQYVTFEVAKLLKEKGFDWPCICYYEDNGIMHEALDYVRQNDGEDGEDDDNDECLCPTQQMAMRWLREEKGIHIMVSTGMNVCSKPMRFYHANLAQMEEDKTIYGDPIDVDFDTYEDAVEAALKYVLTNLI